MMAYIGRQAIYNNVFNVAGYELLYRRSDKIGATGLDIDGDEMTKSVLLDAVNVFGIKNLTNGLPAFINFTRNLILEDFAYLIDPRDIVIEVPSDIFVSDALVSRLYGLQRAGYRISLNSYNEKNGRMKFDKIIGSFDIVRLDISGKNRLQIKDLLQRLRFTRTQLLAERVETQAEFEMVQALKFTLFQGYYFERPDTVSKQVPLAGTTFGRMVAELMQTHPNFEMCCRIVENDTLFTHLFLRHVLKARYNRENIASEVRRAMTLFGLDSLREWTTVQFLKQVNKTASDELARRAFLRGRFMERLVQNADTTIRSEEAFFLGILSLLDQVTGTSLDTILHEMKPAPELEAALRGMEEGDYTSFLRYAIAYETASGSAQFPYIELHLGDRNVSNLYMECMAETDRAFQDDDRVKM